MGFSGITMAKAEHMTEEAINLEKWLTQGHHGSMSYMENHFDKRVDPTKLVPGSKTVISLMYNYYTEEQQTDPSAPKLAMYAFGKDYHKVLKRKLHELFNWMQSVYGEIEGRCFTDSAPVLERDWARRSGLGWVGKNTLLLSKQKGSYFFLGEIICDLEMEYDHPIKDHCGTCTRCIDACPTEAISPQGYIMDGSRCISYLTIERKEVIPSELKDHMEGWVFGCDICQQVCPWNRFSTPHEEPKFEPKAEMLDMKRSDWKAMTEETYEHLFNGTPVRRVKYERLSKNINIILR